MKQEFSVLKECMRSAGKIVRSHFGKTGYELKAKANLVTIADVKVQKAVLSIIKKNFPSHDFLAEEDGLKNTHSDYIWVIDPIDGTTNFAHGFPQCSVSIALFYKGRVTLGGVYDVMKEELFLARKGKGATLNGKKINVSRVKHLSEALLVTGFPYTRDAQIDRLLHTFKNFIKACHDIRRLGSAALDLCWVACGRLDGYWEENLNPWDVSAGKLILEEAGGKVTDFSGKPWKKLQDYGKEVLATNKTIHPEMFDIMKKEK